MSHIKNFLPYFLMTLGFAIMALLLILIGYSYEWTGFGASTIPITPNQELQQPKKFWDWLELLVIPLVLAVSAAWFSRAERRSEQAIADRRNEEERSIADDRAQELALQSYLEQMSTLLIDKALRQSEDGSEVRDIARAWTLTFLRRMNKERKGILLRFLYESDLITQERRVISMNLADLSGAELHGADFRSVDLEEANLSGAKLMMSDLSGAQLYRTNLNNASLFGAQLFRANLPEAELEEANLHRANLKKANLLIATLHSAILTEANLVEADLGGANLMGANLMGANLMGANLEGAILSNTKLMGADLTRANLIGTDLTEARYSANTIWNEGFEPLKHGAILVED